MISLTDYLNLPSNLESRSVIAMETLVCVTYDELEGSRFVISVEVVGMECVFLEGDTTMNKDWVGLVKCSEGQRHVD